MRRPIKPFAVEVRRGGRRVPQSFIPTREMDEAPQPDYFTLQDFLTYSSQLGLGIFN